MKICMVGLGSIGKRHLGNLITALERRGRAYQIDALRSSRTPLGEKWESRICRQYDAAECLPGDYDAVFVTNPTSLHYDTIQELAPKTKHMFIEKPVFDSPGYNPDDLPLKEDGIYYVACPLRHKGILKYIKERIVEEEKIISVRVVSTSYLPSWREGMDYRTVYSADKDMGGGVTRDLIHEWDYIQYLFGIPEKVCHIQEHVSELEINSDDVSVYLARYPGMILEMHLDYIGQKTERMLQLFTNDKRMDADLVSDVIYEYQGDRLVRKMEFPKEDHYLNEIEYFLDCMEGRRKNFNTVGDAYRTLETAMTEE